MLPRTTQQVRCHDHYARGAHEKCSWTLILSIAHATACDCMQTSARARVALPRRDRLLPRAAKVADSVQGAATHIFRPSGHPAWVLASSPMNVDDWQCVHRQDVRWTGVARVLL